MRSRRLTSKRMCVGARARLARAGLAGRLQSVTRGSFKQKERPKRAQGVRHERTAASSGCPRLLGERRLVAAKLSDTPGLHLDLRHRRKCDGLPAAVRPLHACLRSHHLLVRRTDLLPLSTHLSLASLRRRRPGCMHSLLGLDVHPGAPARPLAGPTLSATSRTTPTRSHLNPRRSATHAQILRTRSNGAELSPLSLEQKSAPARFRTALRRA